MITPPTGVRTNADRRGDLLAQVLDDSRRMVSGLGRLLEEQRIRVEGLARGLPDPTALLRSNEQRLDDLSERLRMSVRTGETSAAKKSRTSPRVCEARNNWSTTQRID